jgi:inner membrane protein involved in colicin E2 resistance
VEQYDLDIIDDKESPCDVLQRMTIGEVRHQDSSEQQVVAPNNTTPLAQNHDQDEKEEDQEDEIKKNKINLMMKIKIMIKRKAMIKEELRMMGFKKDQRRDHLTQECATRFKEFTLLITFLVISKRGNY